MRGLRRVFKLGVFRQEDVARDVDEELEFHLAMREARLRAAGLSGDEAVRLAHERFGDLASIRGECVQQSRGLARMERVFMIIEEIRRDAAFAVRSLRRAPAFTTAVVLTLALGIGANAIMYALLDATVLTPVSGVHAPGDVFEMADIVSYPEFRELQGAVKGADVAAMRERRMAIGTAAGMEHAEGAHVSGNFFSVIGAAPAVGRLIGKGDDAPGNAVAVISHDYWRRAYGGDSAVTGKEVMVNGTAFTIIGVAPKSFTGLHLGTRPLVWLPIQSWPLSAPSSRSADIEKRSWSWLSVVVRKRADVSSAQLHEALTAGMLALDPGYPPLEMRKRAEPRPLQAAALNSGSREAVVRFGGIMAAVVALVLLAACANIAGLLLSRAVYRRREIGVRIALGAGRVRLVRQLVTESLVLAAAGSATALAMFVALRSVISRVVLPGGFSGGALDLAVDARMIAVLLVITVVTGVILGLAPALESLRTDTVAAIKGAAQRTRGKGTLRGVLVTVQVATALVLLAGTGLFARALRTAFATDIGFDETRLVTLTVDPGLVQFDAPRALAYYDAVIASVSRMPGVRGATLAGNIPLNNDRDFESVSVAGYAPAPGERVRAEFGVVGANYHTVVGIPMTDGRTFSVDDRQGTSPSVVVNETFARKYFAGRRAVGGTVEILGRSATVIGVARDIKYHTLNETPTPYVYLAAMQMPPAVGSPRLIASVDGRAAAMVRPIAESVRSVNPAVPVFDEGTMTSRLNAQLAPQLAGSWLLGVFSVLALSVASVGIYGVVAYAVSQRTRELGIRMALGARKLDVILLVARRNLGFVLLGVPIGLGIALVLGRAASRFLFGVNPANAPVMVTMSLVIIGVGAVASYIPARRALRVDPLLSLRTDA
jgi:predicted permease